MPVRTTKIDVAALARSAPAAPARSGGGVGSYGLGVAPAFTGYAYEADPDLAAGQSAYFYFARFLAEPYNASTTYELVDDLGGAIGTSPDGGAPFEFDEDGYLKLFTSNTPLEEGEFTFQVRATLGMQSQTFTLPLTVQPEPVVAFDYTVGFDSSTFDIATAQGTPLGEWLVADDRLTLTEVAILTDAGNVFGIDDDNVTLVRGSGAVEDAETYSVVVQFTFTGDDANPATTRTSTLNFDTFSIG